MKTCDGCVLENEDDNETCDNCSRIDNDRECSCHINPPCSFCVEDKYEEKVKPILKLSSIDGNAFVILGAATKALKAEIEALKRECPTDGEHYFREKADQLRGIATELQQMGHY